MRKWIVVGTAALALMAGGCKDKPKEVSVAARAEAAQHASEADFAVQVREYERAEGLFAKATELDAPEPRYWLQLGAVRKRLGNTSGARAAYEQARRVLQTAYKKDKKSPGPLFAQMEVCLLLGQPDEAKKVYDRLLHDHPDDRDVKNFAEKKMFEQLLVDQNLKAMGL